MNSGIVTAAYIVAAILFILSLAGLSNQESARRGNMFGIAGMAIAIIATILSRDVTNYGALILMMAIGGGIGAFLASRVEMTQMPELVAILHSFVGLAAVLVGFASYLDPDLQLTGAEHTIHSIEVYLGILIGALTFTGSVIAWGKLNGKIGSAPLILPNRHLLNLGVGVVCLILLFIFLGVGKGAGAFILIVMTLLAFAFGIHMVMAIGGADMPCLLYTSPSPRDRQKSRMPSSA